MQSTIELDKFWIYNPTSPLDRERKFLNRVRVLLNQEAIPQRLSRCPTSLPPPPPTPHRRRGHAATHPAPRGSRVRVHTAADQLMDGAPFPYNGYHPKWYRFGYF